MAHKTIAIEGITVEIETENEGTKEEAVIVTAYRSDPVTRVNTEVYVEANNYYG